MTGSLSHLELRQRFFDAFADRPRPSEEEIVRQGITYDGDEVRDLLSRKSPSELSDQEIQSVVETRLSLLTPKAYLHFLPAFLSASLASYEKLSVFASELIGSLTLPARADIEDSMDRLASNSLGSTPLDDQVPTLRDQQLEWYDSGVPMAIFRKRFEGLSTAEGAAIYLFLDAFRDAYAEDFLPGELETAVQRYWVRYRAE